VRRILREGAPRAFPHSAELGHRLFFLSAMEMARRLGAAFRENRLPHAMKMFTQLISCSQLLTMTSSFCRTFRTLSVGLFYVAARRY
jgi:hypothetical protein